MPEPSAVTVAFVGTGVMGGSMAGHLMDAGYRMVVHTRSAEKAAGLLERGAEWADSAGEAASGADVTITMVGYPSDVEDVYLGPGGIVERAKPGSVLVDMTTSSPALAQRIAKSAAGHGFPALDAPVSGGDVGARNATLTIMVGGDPASFARVEPLFEVMGKKSALLGGPGAGQHAKMANQIAIAASMIGLCEAMDYAQRSGLDPAAVLDSLLAGGAQSWSLANYAPRIFNGDFEPGFYVKHFVKDMRIAIASADAMGMELPGLDLAKRLYERLMNAGGGDLGTQALWLLYADAEARRSSGVGPTATVRDACSR